MPIDMFVFQYRKITTYMCIDGAKYSDTIADYTLFLALMTITLFLLYQIDYMTQMKINL